jgi:hypothetical protein
MCPAQVLSWKMKTVNWGLVYKDVLQLGKHGTSKEFFSLKRYALWSQNIWHIACLCFCLMDTKSLQKIPPKHRPG